MGADIRTAGKTAVIRGVEKLQGAEVSAADRRGGAALVTAALAAEGETVIHGMDYVDRGYEDLARTLRELGAKAERIG